MVKFIPRIVQHERRRQHWDSSSAAGMTPRQIDHDVYPEIFDRILSYASDGVLSAFLRTGSETAERAAKLLYRELLINPTNPGGPLDGYCFSKAPGAIGTIRRDWSRPVDAGSNRFLKFVQVVTTPVHCPTQEPDRDAPSHTIDPAALLPNLKVWRYSAHVYGSCCYPYHCHPFQDCDYARLFGHARHMVIITSDRMIDRRARVMLKPFDISTASSSHYTFQVPSSMPYIFSSSPGDFERYVAADGEDRNSGPTDVMTLTFVFSGVPERRWYFDLPDARNRGYIEPFVTQLAELAVMRGVVVEVIGEEHFDGQMERKPYRDGDATLEQAVQRESDKRYGTRSEEGRKQGCMFRTLEDYIGSGQGEEAFGQELCQKMVASLDARSARTSDDTATTDNAEAREGDSRVLDH